MADNENNENKKPDKQSSDNQALENKSLEELHKQIEKGKRKISRSFVFAIAALVAIVAIGIAWFVSNTKVSAIGARVSAENPISFELGSTGYRQTVEQSYFTENGSSILNDGTNEPFKQYADINTGVVTSGSINLNIGTSNLAWYLNGQENFWPGASGKLEFYIIPRQNNLKSVTITWDMEAYKKTSDTDATAVKISGDANLLNGLLSGHILLFDNLTDEKGYSGWKNPATKSITINAPSNSSQGQDTTDTQSDTTATFIENVPYKVTLYWVWPKYFRNYIYGSRNIYGDLFTDISSNNADHTSLLNFVEASDNKDKLFVGYSDNDNNEEIIDTMTDTILDKWSGYYDLADEYIGNNVDYVYVNITVGQ